MVTTWRTDGRRSEYKQRNELGGYCASPDERMMVTYSTVMTEGLSWTFCLRQVNLPRPLET